MFAASLFFEREPLQMHDLGPGLFEWIRYGGAISGVVLVLIGVILALARAQAQHRVLLTLLPLLGGLVLSAVCAVFLAPPDRSVPTAGDNFWSVAAVGAGVACLAVTLLILVAQFRVRGFLGYVAVLGLVAEVLCYGAYLLSLAPYGFRFVLANSAGVAYQPPPFSEAFTRFQAVCVTAGGASAWLTVLVLFFAGVFRVNWRRIWAVARLTSLEVFRNRLMWSYALIALLFLFAPWFIRLASIPQQAQVYTWTQIFYLTMSVLLGITTSLLASTGIHNDIKSQTIHTVLTKPVERYEIVLGRFLGYALMMTLGLAVLTSLSLVFLLRGVDATAQQLYLKARVPVYGSLQFKGTANPDKGENVGEEWEYRGYISGPSSGAPPQYAVWSMADLPPELARRDRGVPCEFTFSIYRTTTGDIGGGVKCQVEVRTWRWDPNRLADYKERADKLPPPELTRSERELPPEQQEKLLKERWAPWNRLATVYGYFLYPSKSVTNGVTEVIEVPAGLFKSQLATKKDFEELLAETRQQIDARQKEAAAAGAGAAKLNDEVAALRKEEKVLAGDLERMDETRPPLQVWVSCTDRTQFLGMAKYDLYLLNAEQPFWVNFYKGVAGIWLFNVLVIGLGVCFSTVLNGVVSWLGVMFFVGLGMLRRDYLEKVAMGTNEGGGPAEAWLKLVTGQMPSAVLEDTTGKKVATFSDEVFRWGMRQVLNVFPDVTNLNFAGLVATGFDVSLGSLLVTAAYLLAYLVPVMVLAYFMIRSREIAAAT